MRRTRRVGAGVDRADARMVRTGRRSQAGVSLVEMVVATSLVVTVMAVIGPVLVSNVNATSGLSAQGQVLDDLRRAARQIERDVRSASCISGPVVGSSSAALNLTTRDSAGNDLAVVVTMTGTSLTRSVAGGPATIVVADLTGAATSTFVRGSDRRVTVTLTAAVDRGRSSRTFVTVVGARTVAAGCLT